jgi:hypothetical protein
MAIVEARLIDDDRHEFYERSYRNVPEMILINNFCQFAVCSFLEVRRIYNEPPTKEMLEQLIMGVIQRTCLQSMLLSFNQGGLSIITQDDILFAEATAQMPFDRRGIFSCAAL